MKAVRIKDGQAEVIQERCIECGNCIRVCSQNAKEVLDNRLQVKQMLEENQNVSLILAPSFVASFDIADHRRLITVLKDTGFKDIWPAALGAQLIIPVYEELLFEQEMVISSPCPAVVNLIEKHYPSLIKYLSPIVSPMVATAKYIKSINPDSNIVFAGPCTAKKGEIFEYNGLIDYCLTFGELESFMQKGDSLNKDTRDDFNGPIPYNGQIIPLSGGLKKMLELKEELLETKVIVVEGQKECLETMEAIASGLLKARFIDILMCKGCIDGPGINTNKYYHNRKKRIVKYFEDIPINERLCGKVQIAGIKNLDLFRTFHNRKVEISQPREEDIRAILARTNKYSIEDELNCGACGYETCRDKAIAVHQGIAEVEMCLPYLIEKKNKLIDKIDYEYRLVKELHSEVEGIIKASYDGICVTDNNGIIVHANSAFEHLYGLRKELIGTYAGELEEQRIAAPSATLLVLKEKRPVTIVQDVYNGRKLLVTGTPIFSDEGELSKVLLNARDFEELEIIKNKFYSNLYREEKPKRNYGTEKLIAYSPIMASVLETCRKVASVESTVLITGESGVGKEVVANYLHSISPQKSKAWVKVNCGTIPESLIESELFGYEAGSFTGANKDGKKGFFELAHHGTIFLDEIGELPLQLQVKLLQVLQEKCLVRIGGMKPIYVDVRIIAATNRNLKDMVDKGDFREDLYYRLNVVPIQIPPLRKRQDDIIPLTNHFLELFCKKYGVEKHISREVMQIFLNYAWPGNIRELTNLVERLVVISDKVLIEKSDLPLYIKDKSTESNEEIPELTRAVERLEKEILEKAAKTYSSSYKIAKALGLNQSTVFRKMKKYGIKVISENRL